MAKIRLSLERLEGRDNPSCTYEPIVECYVPPPPPPACVCECPDPGKPAKVKGNNGVGNGLDPPPPGNPPINDGPGTSPGSPGNRGGKK